MNHEEILEWLPAYYDGELPPGKLTQVETHLQDCPTCRAELEMLNELSAMLKADPLPSFTAPDRFVAQVQLLLPRRAAKQATNWLSTGLLIAPLLLMMVWAFFTSCLMDNFAGLERERCDPQFGRVDWWSKRI